MRHTLVLVLFTLFIFSACDEQQGSQEEDIATADALDTKVQPDTQPDTMEVNDSSDVPNEMVVIDIVDTNDTADIEIDTGPEAMLLVRAANNSVLPTIPQGAQHVYCTDYEFEAVNASAIVGSLSLSWGLLETNVFTLISIWHGDQLLGADSFLDLDGMTRIQFSIGSELTIPDGETEILTIRFSLSRSIVNAGTTRLQIDEVGTSSPVVGLPAEGPLKSISTTGFEDYLVVENCQNVPIPASIEAPAYNELVGCFVIVSNIGPADIERLFTGFIDEFDDGARTLENIRFVDPTTGITFWNSIDELGAANLNNVVPIELGTQEVHVLVDITAADPSGAHIQFQIWDLWARDHVYGHYMPLDRQHTPTRIEILAL